MNSLVDIIIIVLVFCSLVLVFLRTARKVPTYTFKQLKDKNTDIDKLVKMKYGFKTIQDLVSMCIIGSAVNSMNSNCILVWGALIYGIVLYLILAFALYNFKMKIEDLKKNSLSKSVDKE